jgi:hypothetical protein
VKTRKNLNSNTKIFFTDVSCQLIVAGWLSLETDEEDELEAP